MLTQDDYRQYQQRKALLQAQLAKSLKRLEQTISVRAVLGQRVQQILQAMERHKHHRVFTTGEVEEDSALQMLQQQLAQTQKRLAVVKQAETQERVRVRRNTQMQWQLWVEVERFKRHRTQASKASSRQLDPLQGHVVPSYKTSNPLRDLRRLPSSEIRNTVLPSASAGLLLEIAIALAFGASSLALLGGLTLMGLWSLAPGWERGR